MDDLSLADGRTIPGRELSWAAVASGGPGGQHVNKVATKVQLRWDFSESELLPAWARRRLIELAGKKIDAEGRVLISVADTRSQDRNLEIARERLAALVAEALDRPKRRKRTRPSRAAKRRRLEEKRKHSAKKQGRRQQYD